VSSDLEKLLALPAAERLRLAETLLASLPGESNLASSLPAAQQRELDRLLDEFDTDGNDGRPADEVMREVRKTLWPGS
jgi:putative addiction module component (TIGR02574 family)